MESRIKYLKVAEINFKCKISLFSAWLFTLHLLVYFVFLKENVTCDKQKTTRSSCTTNDIDFLAPKLGRSESYQFWRQRAHK
jgi:hypothetical protein